MTQQNRVKVLQPNGSSSVRLCWSIGAQPWSRHIFASTVRHEMGWGECPKPGADGGLGTHQEKPCCQLQKRSSRCQVTGEGAGEGSYGRWNLSLKRQVSGEGEGDPMAGGTCLYLPGWGGATAQNGCPEKFEPIWKMCIHLCTMPDLHHMSALCLPLGQGLPALQPQECQPVSMRRT